jgi:hypothetical protein
MPKNITSFMLLSEEKYKFPIYSIFENSEQNEQNWILYAWKLKTCKTKLCSCKVKSNNLVETQARSQKLHIKIFWQLKSLK